MRKELKWDQTAVDHIVGQWYSEQAGRSVSQAETFSDYI